MLCSTLCWRLAPKITMPHRLPPQPGEWIARDAPLSFTFEGETYTACAGDTVSSALLAEGVRVLGRSFKYHRRRGVLSAANHDANVLLQTGVDLNLRGDVVPVLPGETYTAVNTFGGLRQDRGQLIEILSRLLPVGFYYKTFHRPRQLFPLWERMIRRLSGLGRVNRGFPVTRSPSRRLHCDCLVIGAGPSGLAAALRLAAAGVQVVLVDENARPGGSAAWTAGAQPWLASATASIASAPSLTLVPDAFAAGLYSDLEVPLISRGGMTLVTPRSVLVTTGVIEQPAVFRNNDLPGVMLASAAQRLVARYAVAPFTQGVMLAGNPEALEATAWFLARGLVVEAILLLPGFSPDAESLADLKDRGVRIVRDVTALEALPQQGVLVGLRCASGGHQHHFACDGLLMSVGWAPASQLLHQGGVRFEHDAILDQRVPATLPTGLHAAGRVNGVHEFEARLRDGEAAADEILSSLGWPSAGTPRPARATVSHSHPSPFFAHPHGKNFVDFDEDIQLHDLEVACREGFDNVELLKRYTTNGMGPSQGKHSNLNAARWLAARQGLGMDAVGATTARPFYHPVPMGVLAGRRIRPQAHGALEAEHRESGVVWMEAGPWLRPRHYAHADGDGLAEYRAVREGVGMIDVSTLGKLEIFGRDAVRLLELGFTGRLASLKPGRSRYVLMCDQRGTLVDDGLAARLGDQHFYLTAGSGHVQATFRQLTQIAALYGLQVEVVDRTRQMSALNVAGPRARALLQPHTPQPLDDQAFPFTEVRDTTLFGLPARMMRVGFVGETGFEVHVRYGDGPVLWQALREAGAAFGLRPFGVETQRLLRLEKGHLIVGHDTDGVMHPFETPLAALVALEKPQFLGKAALSLLQQQVTRRLIGFETATAGAEALEECHLILRRGEISGRITSVARSPVLGKTIGLAVLELSDGEPLPSDIEIRNGQGRLVGAALREGAFYDPGNARQREGV